MNQPAQGQKLIGPRTYRCWSVLMPPRGDVMIAAGRSLVLPDSTQHHAWTSQVHLHTCSATYKSEL